MNAQEQMEWMDEVIGCICENLGTLTRNGVLSHEYSIEIIGAINNKHLQWMQSKFSPAEIYKFVYQKE